MADTDMFSPLNDRGQARLQSLRACIRRQYGPGGAGRAGRTLQMPAAGASKPTPVAPTARAKVRRRMEQAALLTSDEIFFGAFGDRDELLATEFDLVRPSAPVKPRPRASAATSATAALSAHGSFGSQQHAQMHTQTHTQVAAAAATRPAAGGVAYSSAFASQPSTGLLGPAASTSAFTSALPAPSTARVSQLPRPTRVRTPRKAAVKRPRSGDSSAEKALPLQKPRLGDYNRSSSSSSSAGIERTHAFSSLGLAARKDFSFVTSRRGYPSSEQAGGSAVFVTRTSPSKFPFPSTSSRLLMPRQAPLR